MQTTLIDQAANQQVTKITKDTVHD